MVTGEQIKAARKLLGWSEATLATSSRCRIIEVIRAESGKLPRQQAAKQLAIQAVLETAGLEFLEEPPWARLKPPHKAGKPNV